MEYTRDFNYAADNNPCAISTKKMCQITCLSSLVLVWHTIQDCGGRYQSIGYPLPIRGRGSFLFNILEAFFSWKAESTKQLLTSFLAPFLKTGVTLATMRDKSVDTRKMAPFCVVDMLITFPCLPQLSPKSMLNFGSSSHFFYFRQQRYGG